VSVSEISSSLQSGNSINLKHTLISMSTKI